MKPHAGSAALISEDTILTAAHNLYDKKMRSLNSQFKFYIGADGVAERYYEIENWRFPEEFKTCKSSVVLQYDYAIMKLRRPIFFDQYLPVS